MGKRLAAIGMAAALGVGGLTVAAVNPLGVAGASTPTSSPPPASAAPGKGHQEGVLQKTLDKLVADGTLTQAQADKVIAAVKAEAKATRQERRGNRKDRRQEMLAVAAKAIGVTPDEVQAGLKNGTSIAKQAEAKGVDRKVMVDALTKAFTTRIDASVKDEMLTAERAEKAKERLPKAVDRLLDGTGGHRSDRESGGGHHRGRPGGN